MAAPVLALIPSTIGTKVYSAIPADGTGDFTFTRATSATRTNKDGLIEVVDSGDNRLDYNGGCPRLLLEPARTNLVTYSADINTYLSSKNDATITYEYGISPDGTLNSSRVQFVDSTAYASRAVTISSEQTASIYVKGVAGQTIMFGFGSSVTTGSIYTFTGEWQRLTFTGTSGTQIFLSTYGLSTARDFEAFGLQLEAGAYASSYIPTNGSAVTRNSETTPFPAVYNFGTLGDGESGTLVIETDVVGIDDRLNILSQGGSGNWFWGNAGIFYIRTLTTTLNFNMGTAIGLLVGSTIKIAIRKDGPSVSVFYNGVLRDTLDMGTDSFIWASHLSAYESAQGVRKVLEYNTALSNAECIELTS